MTIDFAAENYYARHDGTNATEDDGTTPDDEMKAWEPNTSGIGAPWHEGDCDGHDSDGHRTRWCYCRRNALGFPIVAAPRREFTPTNASDVADEAESWTFTVIGQAGLYGVPTATDLAVCVCKNGTHREISRVPVKTDREAATQMSLDAARGLDPHTIARTNLALQTGWEIVP